METRRQVAIVTGSATGVGAATVRMLAARGWNVVVNYTRSDAEARETQAACEAEGAETLLCQADVADDADCRRMVSETVAKWGRIDALVNNAGITKFVDHANLEGLAAEDFLRIYAVNVVGAFQMVRAVAPHMKAVGRGAIVNVSSIAGVMGIGSSIAYVASKGALNTMTLALARVLGPEIRVNTVCPGFIEGRWLRQGLGDAGYEAAKAAQERTAALRRVATPEDIAEAIVWLIEGARHITGEIILVDGGAHLAGAPLIAR